MSAETVPPKTRIESIDAVKGISIALVTLVFMGSYIRSPNFWDRLISTLAPFQITAGFTIAFTRRRHSLKNDLYRAAILLGFDAALDMLVWRKAPWICASPLFTIAVATPIVSVLARMKGYSTWIAYATTIVLAVGLQHWVGYRVEFAHQKLWWQYRSVASEIHQINGFSEILRSWLIDGWAPIFPYMAFMIFGAWFALYYRTIVEWSRQRPWKASSILFGFTALSALVWYLYPGPAYRRYGYLELSYPPTPGYVLCLCCFFVFLIFLSERYARHPLFRGFSFLGKTPLFAFIYINLVMRFVVYPHVRTQLGGWAFLGLYAAVIAGYAVVLFPLRKLRTWLKPYPMPLPVRILLGG